VPRIAVSGHRSPPPTTTQLVAAAIREALRTAAGPVTGLSCLADGADQVFARAVLEAGGSIVAVIPAAEYRAGLPGSALAEYDSLLAAAATGHRLPFTESTAGSHMAASEFMISRAAELWAVWDGKPARGFGGTADVVTYARDQGVPVRVIWPEGSQRDQG
jgi:hypothetical protein